MATFKLTLVSPRGKALEQDVESVVAPGAEGEFGVLADHAPMIAALQSGVVKVSSSDGTQFFGVGDGVAEVFKNEMSILVDVAEKAASHDEAKKIAADIKEKTKLQKV